MYQFVCYPTCSTCKKAMAYMDAHHLPYTIRNIKEARLSADEIRAVYIKSGRPLRQLFNTSGLVYRQLDLKSKIAHMSEDEMIALLASDGMLVKRPLLISAHHALIGFSETEYSKLVQIHDII